MDESEFFVFAVSGIMAIAGWAATSTLRMHSLYFRDARGPGLVRVATWLGLAWVAYVLWRHADPSVTGIYVLFYLVMSCAAIFAIAPIGGAIFGARHKVDIHERRNFAAAIFYAAFSLATALVFGGCLWGEADPVGDDEGGWWIPVGFFLAGWGTLLLGVGLFFWREPGPTRLRIRQDRSVSDAQAAAVYTLTSAVTITQAVAGDFHGWRHGLLAVGFISVLLILREVFGLVQDSIAGALGRAGRSRGWESAAYLGFGLVFWFAQGTLESWMTGSS